MDLFLDPALTGAKTAMLFEQLREAIVSGRLAGGDRLPPSRHVATRLGVSRNTVTTVYGRLAAEGYITGRAGAGSYVSSVEFGQTYSRHQPTALVAAARVTTPRVLSSVDDFDIRPRFDLRSGRPDPAMFPLVEWRRCMTTALQTPPDGYGNPAGLDSLRRAIAHWVGVSRAVVATAEQVIVTSGAQQAIDLVTRLLVTPGQVVAIEDPGYPPVARLLAASSAVVVSVPVDAHGIVVDQIPQRARMVYTTPSHQSPTGVTMSMVRRHELLKFANRHDVAIIEDDYDSEYRHGDRPLEPLYRLDRSGRVIYVGTFSKTLSPSLRLGFVVLPESLIAPAVNLRSLIDWQPPAAMQTALLRFIADGHLDRHLRQTRKVYSHRHRIVAEFVHRAVADDLLIEPTPSYAGLHIAALLPAGIDETTVRSTARADGVVLGDYGQCWQRSDPPAGLIVGFGSVATSKLPDALEILRRALESSTGRRARS